ncbi:hypothetical protein [Actinoplanes derwentensis]|uniref:Uncharacterized protein n=1 Tax=Actinoplanes derwentensis TaxID=113562 RepID=A0A1H2CW86_9ACTN|nr:hypothetical protein [Actinoplanes derwentensis]SDT74472.1 hypothetical protein SAMN04489716_6992 [Actinoplanes derwentensis]
MERRIPSSTQEIAGATLTISTMGGFSVEIDGRYIGFMHATHGALFNAYQRVPGERGNWLGRHSKEGAVRAIMRANGLVPTEVA